MPVDTDPDRRTPEDDAPAAIGAEDAAPRRRLLPWIAGAAAAAAVVAVIVLVSGGDDGSPSARRAPAVSASEAKLASLPADVGHAVFWAGKRPATTYELTRTAGGRVFIRYLPAGVAVGSRAASYLTVGSYPQRDALATLESAARAQGAETVALPDGGRAFQDARRPTSAYAAFPGTDVQIEVFDARPGQALRTIASGELVRIGAKARELPGAIAPRLVSAAQLRTFAAGEDGPVYWAGPRDGSRYELTRTVDGRIYVRYLSAGTKAGSTDPSFLTIGTYPQADALATLKETASRRGAGTFAVAGGGVGAVLRGNPDSVYLAYPGANVQVEAFDPDGGARGLAEGGAIVPVR